MMINAVKRNPGVCPVCGELHEMQTLRMAGFHIEGREDNYYEDWLYCNRMTALYPSCRETPDKERFPLLRM